MRTRLSRIATLVPALALLVAAVALAARSVTVTEVSSDPYANATSFHATEVEPDTFSFGSTIVAAFQAGRFANGGASNIGWATSSNGGTSWTHGFLPGTTAFSTPKGKYARESDPSVAYDAAHKTWLIAGLAINAQVNGVAVLVNRSTNGGLTWSLPATVDAISASQFFDKDWIACDDTATSPHYGSCYAEWDDAGDGNQLHMAYSRNGGVSWAQSTVPSAGVIGGQPVVQPNGDVVMPINDAAGSVVESFISANGGVTYTGPTQVATVSNHVEAGNLRSSALPTVEVTKSGRVYVSWADCRFRAGCAANDIVFSSSIDGMHWTRVQRIPFDATTSGVDHFLPGLGVAVNSSGTTARLGLTYYYYPKSSCTTATCQLDVGYVSSSTGGTSWTAPTQLAGPAKLNELPLTTQGYMVGDYISTSLVSGLAGAPALSVFAVGLPVAGKTCTAGQLGSCHESMVAPAAPLPSGRSGLRPVRADPVLSGHSDHRTTTRLTFN